MKLLCIEATADGLLDLAITAQRLGHQCRYVCGAYDPVKAPVGRGLVERVADWRGSTRWADLVVVAGNGKWMRELDAWRATGVPMIGGCAEAAAWELDRLAGMAAFKRAGIPVPPFRQCSTLRDALAYVEARDEGCAVKPCGSIDDKSTSIVGKDAESVCWRLGRWIKEGKSFPAGVIVQDRIEGVEFAVGAWIGPDGFAPGWEINAEEKALFAGNIGSATGEQGTTMMLKKREKLAEKVLEPLEDRLVSLGYCGNVDVNSIVTPEGVPFPLEFTMRLGWPAFNIECALHEDPVEYLAGLAAGKPPNTRRLDEVAVGVVLSLPPYPHGHERHDEVVGVPVWGMTPSIEERVHLCMAQRSGDQLTTAGSYVCVVTGTGESVQKARDAAYRTVERLSLPIKPQYRTDIGQRLRSGLDQLQQHGFAAGMSYS